MGLVIGKLVSENRKLTSGLHKVAIHNQMTNYHKKLYKCLIYWSILDLSKEFSNSFLTRFSTSEVHIAINLINSLADHIH
jgi:hypothetical protein